MYTITGEIQYPGEKISGRNYTLNRNISVPNFTMFIISYHVSLILKSVLFHAHSIPQISSCVKALGVAIGVQTGPNKSQRPHILSIVLERSVLF